MFPYNSVVTISYNICFKKHAISLFTFESENDKCKISPSWNTMNNLKSNKIKNENTFWDWIEKQIYFQGSPFFLTKTPGWIETQNFLDISAADEFEISQFETSRDAKTPDECDRPYKYVIYGYCNKFARYRCPIVTWRLYSKLFKVN